MAPAPPDPAARDAGPREPSAAALTLQAVAVALGRRAAAEWRAAPLHRLGLEHPRATGLAARPRDLRPPDAAVGTAVLAGRFPLAGAELEAPAPGDPWDRPSPSRRLAVELHRFAWLPSLLAEGDAGAREGLRLLLAWRRLFDRPAAFAWSAEVLERRVFNWSCALGAVASEASEAESAALSQSLARQARHLLGDDPGPARRAERLAAVAIAGAALAGPAGERLSARAARRLGPALDAAVLADGGLRTRSPEQAMELLFDLMTLDDALVQRGREAPDGVARALDRLGGAVRVFALGDGRLAAFNGGGSSDRERVAAALAYDGAAGRPYDHAPHSGYHRLQAPALHVIADAAGPPPGGWSEAACAQPAAIEVVCGGERLIAGGGWTPDADAPAAMRLAPAASTAALGQGSPGAPLAPRLARALGARLRGGARDVRARREEDEAGVWLELSCDGWVARTGLLHLRRLFLDKAAGELRGEDRFDPVPERPPRRATPFAVRFHLPPAVRGALARDGRSVLIRGASDCAWWLRNDAPEVAIEPSVVVERGVARRAGQVVLRGLAPPEGGRVRWKLVAAGPA